MAVFSCLPGCTSLHMARTQQVSILLLTRVYLPPHSQDPAGQYSPLYQGVPPSTWTGPSRALFSCLPGCTYLHMARLSRAVLSCSQGFTSLQMASSLLFTRVYLPPHGQNPAGHYSPVCQGIPPSTWPGPSRAEFSCLPGCTSLLMDRTQQGSIVMFTRVYLPPHGQASAGQYSHVDKGVSPFPLPGPSRAVFFCLPGCTSIHMEMTQ